jgi:hypothetical protein
VRIESNRRTWGSKLAGRKIVTGFGLMSQYRSEYRAQQRLQSSHNYLRGQIVTATPLAADQVSIIRFLFLRFFIRFTPVEVQIICCLVA